MAIIRDQRVSLAFDAFPPVIRQRLMTIRKLIVTTASRTAGVGEIEETLKWGEPAYLTSQSGSGTPIRLAWKKSAPLEYRLLVHCQTHLIDTFRTLHPAFRFDGNRAIIFHVDDELPVDAVRQCIEMALTYHQISKRNQRVSSN